MSNNTSTTNIASGANNSNNNSLDNYVNIPNNVICILATILNITEVLIIVFKKQIKAFERILLSLCLADITISVLYVIENLYGESKKELLFGEHDFLISHIIEYFAILSSITNIIALGVDRFIAVKYPLKHKVWMTKGKINAMILTAWVSSITLSLLINTENFMRTGDEARTSAYVFVAVGFAFGITVTVVYGAIIKTMLNRGKNVQNMSVRKSVRADEIAVTITCLNVVVVFSICTYPFLIDLAIDATPTLPIKFILLNALLDPIVYYFRGYIKKLLYKRSKDSNANAADVGLDGPQKNNSDPALDMKEATL